jgi:hypothetical protein
VRKTAIAGFLAVLLCMVLPHASAGVIQDVALNNNGAYADGVDITIAPFSSTINPTTGLGAITFTGNPGAPGSYFAVVGIDYEVVDAVWWNEYGGASGTPAAGQSWQIDANIADGNFTPTLWSNIQANTLDNTNHVPGTTDNATLSCGANTPGQPVDPTCNTDVAFAMGFAYTLGANQEAVITFNITDSAPTSGFYLSQTHPVDIFDQTAQTIYLAASVSIQGIGPSPEPASLLLVGSAALIGFVVSRRKFGRR